MVYFFNWLLTRLTDEDRWEILQEECMRMEIDWQQSLKISFQSITEWNIYLIHLMQRVLLKVPDRVEGLVLNLEDRKMSADSDMLILKTGDINISEKCSQK